MNQHSCITIIIWSRDISWSVKSVVDRTKCLTSFCLNGILFYRFSHFLPMLIPFLSAYRKFLDWSSLNRWFRLYMRSDVHEIAEHLGSCEYETRWGRKTISFFVLLPFRNATLPVLRVKNVAAKKFCCLCVINVNLFLMYVHLSYIQFN